MADAYLITYRARIMAARKHWKIVSRYYYTHDRTDPRGSAAGAQTQRPKGLGSSLSLSSFCSGLVWAVWGVCSF